MEILNIEIYSLLIIVLLFMDYYHNLKTKADINSKLYSILMLSLLFISLINIIISFISINFFIKLILIIVNYSLAVIPSIILNIYLKINCFENSNIKQTILIGTIFSLLYITLIVLGFYFEGTSIFQINYLADAVHLKWLLLLIILPLLEILFELIIGYIKKAIIFDSRLILTIIIPIIGVFFDIMFPQTTFLVPSFTLSFLLLYLHRNHISLNIDPLTEIYNRRVIEFDLDKILKSDKYIACYLMDIDKFKYINDTYGHKEGDRIIRAVADIIKSSIRKNDYAIRYGGDEFLIIAYLKNKNDTEIIINRLKYKLDEYNEKRKYSVSMSIGYDIYNKRKFKNFESFMKKIDEKMYENKRK